MPAANDNDLHRLDARVLLGLEPKGFNELAFALGTRAQDCGEFFRKTSHGFTTGGAYLRLNGRNLDDASKSRAQLIDDRLGRAGLGVPAGARNPVNEMYS